MGKKKEAKKLAALAAREAELAAELERRKAAKKKGKKKLAKKIAKIDAAADAEGALVYTDEQKAEIDAALAASAAVEPKPEKKGKKKAKHVATLNSGGGMSSGMVDAGALGVMTISAEAPIASEPEPSTARAEIIDADGKTKPEVIAKRKMRAAAEAEKIDAEIAARLAVKKAARKEGKAAVVAEAENVDRSDAAAVEAYNVKAVAVGATLLTSDAEREKIAARGDAKIEALGVEGLKAIVSDRVQVAEVVETDQGREFAVGGPVDDETVTFVKPSDAAPELEEGRNGYKIIQLGADGKPDPRRVRQMTRVTTFVGNIDDETTLKMWDKRMVVEGLALDAHRPETDSIALVVQVNDIVHRRDVAISKAIKADRKGKLGIGEVAEITAAAEKEAKDALNKIVEEAGEIAGRHKKAKAGTHLHSLAEISDAKGIDEVRRMHEEGETVTLVETGEEIPVTATDLASVEAYAARMDRLGAKVMHSEAVIVNDEMGYAGRLDRIIMAKLPELVVNGVVRPADQRAKRYVTDIKSGRVDLGAGKIARQLAAYALGDLYDLETGTRSRHSAAKDVALVFHLPQGEGVCHVHAVDLKAGAALLKLSAEVRRARNTGKKTIDTSVDIADPAPEVEGE